MNWAPMEFSARGKHAVSLGSITLDPASPAGMIQLAWLPQARLTSQLPTFNISRSLHSPELHNLGQEIGGWVQQRWGLDP